jgi:DNA-binding transcriptional MerR regulator
MTIIKDLSDEPKYTIKKVGDLTGILPVTLRAWERRYGVLSPERKENRYRLYSDRDVAILRWLTSQTARGISISTAASNLRNLRMNNEWPNLVPPGITREKVKTSIPPERYAEKLFNLLKQHNEADASKLMQEINSGFDVETVIVRIITPCLISVGEAWYQGNLMISTEHFASAFIRSRLYILFQSYPIATRGANILIGGAPSEDHELGALMMAILLRSRGYRVEFLGPNLHMDDLVDYAKSEKPAAVILTASTRAAAMELLRAQSKFMTIKSPPHFCYAGFAFVFEPGLISEIPGTYLGDSMVKALDSIKQLLTAKPAGKK